jgi:hypothetical protein
MTTTKLQDARAMKSMGAPLNSPIVEKQFSAEYDDHWSKLLNAYDEFKHCVTQYRNKPQWKKLKRCLKELRQIADTDITPTLTDEGEKAILNFFITQRAGPFLDYWDGCVAAVDGGTELRIRPGDVPKWTDDEDDRWFEA